MKNPAGKTGGAGFFELVCDALAPFRPKQQNETGASSPRQIMPSVG
jgi:hypothetical protein